MVKLLQPSTEKRIRLVPLKNVPTSTSMNVRLSTDFRCGTYGSLYDISMRSDGSGKGIVQQRSEGDAFGFDNPSTKNSERKTRTRVIRTTTTTTRKNADPQRPAMLPIISQQPNKTKNTAVSSGKGKLTSQQPVSSYIPVRGGIYDTAMQSGLTKDSLRSRTPYSITLKPSTQRQHCGCKNKNNEVVVPERVSDQRCGVQITNTRVLDFDFEECTEVSRIPD